MDDEDELAYFDDGSDDAMENNDDTEASSLLSRPELFRPAAAKIPPPGSSTEPPRPHIGLLGVTILAFFSVSGGPFGLEVAVAAGGPARTLATLLLFTVFSAIPSALMTAEMSSALPGRGGFVQWVDRGLSTRLGGLNSWLSLLNTAVDASAYPGVCCDYVLFGLRRYGGVSKHLDETAVFWARTACSVTLTIAMCAVNLAGIKLATRAATLLALFALAPFVLMVLICLLTPSESVHSIGTAYTATMATPPTDLPLLLAVCLWSTSGFDAVSFVSAEVSTSPRTFPRAMLYAVLAMLSASALPVLASMASLGDHGGHHYLHAAGDGWEVQPTAARGASRIISSSALQGWEAWSLGSFSVPADRIGGRLLGVWSCAAGVASSLGLLNAFICTSARNVQAMAQRGLLPGVLRGERSEEGTPAPALVFSTASILLLTPFTFAELIELNMSLYSASLLMEQVAFLRLRWTEPDLRRPYKVPIPRRWLALVYLPQIVMCATIILFSLRTFTGVLLWVGTIGAGLLLPRLGHRCFGAPSRESRPYNFGAGRFDAE